ncbi:hypothetical protein B0H10DRAFT_1961280 [Mycena sp. CBHHK59/15]|nr:hypothetical protein B0H10DRAFT_1961280 [Mycena sp. CBHHK59/15]
MKSVIQDSTSPALERSFSEKLLAGGNTQTLGTIQDAAQEETSMRAKASTIPKKADRLSDLLRFGLKQYYNKDEPQVCFPREEIPDAYVLNAYAETYNFALLEGRRIMPTTSQRNSGGSSIIQARQEGVEDPTSTLLAAVAWMKDSKYTPLDNINLWNKFPELGINTWELNSFVDPRSNDPPMIIWVVNIHCQVSRGQITHRTKDVDHDNDGSDI